MSNIEQEITDLAARWFAYTGQDHHKDRDCHWYITKRWSYGDRPYYVAHHEGYRAARFDSGRLKTAHEAHLALRNFLLGEIQAAINYTQSEMEAEEPTPTGFGEWASREQLENELKALRGEV